MDTLIKVVSGRVLIPPLIESQRKSERIRSTASYATSMGVHIRPIIRWNAVSTIRMELLSMEVPRNLFRTERVRLISHSSSSAVPSLRRGLRKLLRPFLAGRNVPTVVIVVPTQNRKLGMVVPGN